MFKSVFFRRLFLPYLLLICLAVGVVGLFAGARLRSSYLENRRQALSDHLELVSQLLAGARDGGASAELSAQVSRIGEALDCRVTVIAEDGRVLADNWGNAPAMDNHGERPEIVEANRAGKGSVARRSSTVSEEMLYLARRVSNPTGYLRLAVRINDLDRQLRQLSAAIAGVTLAAIALGGILCYHFARRHALPVVELDQMADSIARGDLSARGAPQTTGELARVSTTLSSMSQSMRELIMRDASGKAELLTILSSMSEGVIATDAQQQIVLVNEAAATIFGFDQDEALGRPLWQVVRIDRIIKSAQEVLGSGQKRAFELGMVHGRHLEVSLSAYPSPLHLEREGDAYPHEKPGNGNGAEVQTGVLRIAAEAPPKVEGLVVVIHDTTQSVRYQELRREFVANVSHELRTPLTVIKGFVETLRDGAMSDPHKGQEYLATIERHTNQLTNLVNDLLELSRLESQSDVPRRVSVDLASIARRAAESLGPAAQKKNQTLVMEAHRVPLIAGNPDYLERAVSNLIDNAIKYTPETGRISIATRSDGTSVAVEVTDTGIGIPAADIARIFERFYRVDRSRSREMGGTGLGLSIVKHIAQSHGGSVEVESTPGEGSTFRLRLPLPQAAA